MSHARMFVPSFLVSKLFPFDLFFPNILLCTISQLPLGIYSGNFIVMCITGRLGQSVACNNGCFWLL